jgi:phosphatidate cytidylyltransferase
MLKQRVITAVVLLAALIGALWAGPGVFAAAAAILIAAGVFEWLRLAQHSVAVATIIAVAFTGILLAGDFSGFITSTVVKAAAAAALCIWVVLAGVLVQAERSGARLAPTISTLLCLVLLGSAWLSAMQLVRQSVTLLVSALAIVWVADTAAYFAGRRWGRRKLAPKISPGKTWAGAAGALVAVLSLALIAAFAAPQWPLFSSLLLQRWPIAFGLMLLAGVVALSIVGDLFESLLKRQAGAKDSGRLLPGHGGVLDRIDALIPVLPATALILAGVNR